MADSTRNDQLNADPSISTFTSALWFNAAIAVGCYSTFTILRHFRPEVYAPRSYLVDKERQPPPLPKGFLMWILTLLRIPDVELIRIMGLDKFMVLKFLRMGIVVFTLYMLVAIPILIPVNVINQRNSAGLNVMTMGNIKDASRTWAHLVLSVLLTAGVIFYTFYETRRFLNLRRAFLLRPEYANSVTARTLYVPSIPKSVNNVQDLAKIFSKFPGGIRRIWLTRNTKDLPDLVAERAKNVQGLEGAVTSAIKDSYKHYAKAGQQMEEGRTLIPEKLRPTHRVSPLPIGIPFVGRKVDSIAYYRDEIQELNEKISQKQGNAEDFNQYSSAFIEFNQQIAAHMAAQCVLHSQELQMTPRYVQIAPTDIIWENMNINSYERLVRRGISLTITTAIVIFWAIPVTFVQGVSSIQALSKVLPFLEPLNNLPSTAIGIIQGILPAVALAILVALVPIIFRLLSTHEGIPQKSSVDLSVLHKYFFFMFVDVVLISTIAGGIAQTFEQLKNNPLSVINTLSENLPKASTFFITYVLLQSLNSTGQAMLQAVPLVLSYVFPLLKKTPRDIYSLKATCPVINLGTLIPTHTVIFVLGLEYSTIAPLILPFVCLFFYLSYFVYLYQFLYVYEMEYESGGLAFPRAIRHVYIGMFTWQLTMIGLFAVQQGAIGQLVIMIITLIVSCFALALYDKAFRPLFKYLPIQETEEVEELKAKLSRDSNGLDKKASVTENVDQNSVSSTPSKQMEVLERADSRVGLLDAYEARQQLRHRFHQSEAESAAGGGSSHPKADTDALRMIYDVEYYMHPSLYQTQPTVWLPEDDMGITRHEMDELKERKIQTSCYGARAEHAGKSGQKAKIIVDQEKIINGRKGVPGELPGFGPFTTVNDNVRVFIDSYNLVEAMAMNI